MTANGSPSWKFILETYLCVYSSRIEAVTVRLSHKVLTSLGTANLVLYLDCFTIQKHTKISMSLICNHSLCQSVGTTASLTPLNRWMVSESWAVIWTHDGKQHNVSLRGLILQGRHRGPQRSCRPAMCRGRFHFLVESSWWLTDRAHLSERQATLSKTWKTKFSRQINQKQVV